MEYTRSVISLGLLLCALSVFSISSVHAAPQDPQSVKSNELLNENLSQSPPRDLQAEFGSEEFCRRLLRVGGEVTIGDVCAAACHGSAILGCQFRCIIGLTQHDRAGPDIFESILGLIGLYCLIEIA